MISTIHHGDDAFEPYWKQGLKSLIGCTSLYSTGFRGFDREIFSDSIINDDSFVVIYESKIAALVPLYRFENEDKEAEYRYGSEYLRAPIINRELSSKHYQKIELFVFTNIEKLAREYGVLKHKAMIEGIELLEGRQYYNKLSDYNYEDESTVCQIIDLKQEENLIWSNIRKSYKPLINRAKKDYAYEVICCDNYNESKCETYRNLHQVAAGRQTRSVESFYSLYHMILNGEAFLVIVTEHSGKTIAAHLFTYYGKYCLYASSAIDLEHAARTGAGHLGIWLGMLTAKNLGCHYMDMGQLRLNRISSEKEKNIAHFKKGFGGSTVTVFRGTRYYTKFR